MLQLDVPPAAWVLRAWTVGILLCTAGVQGGWPEGTYAIPMSKTGCPEVTDFTWKVGTRTHQTELGSHASDPSHLAGIYTTPSDRVTQSFCVKTTQASDGMYTWQKGHYCIMKVKECPRGFREGWVYWDDAAPWFTETVQNQSGTLPDGDYDRNTKIFFCCRNDGLASEAIELPTNSPFHLLKQGDRCQEVLGMSVSEEYVFWKDEVSMNMNTQGGLYPALLRSKYPRKYTKVFYCYYTKAPHYVRPSPDGLAPTDKPANQNVKTLFTILYVIAGVAGAIIFLLVLMCIIQRIANRKNKQLYDDRNLPNAACERMLQSRDVERDVEPRAAPRPAPRAAPRRAVPPSSSPIPPAEPVVEYRPPEYNTQGDGVVTFGRGEKLPLPPVAKGFGADGAGCSSSSAAAAAGPPGPGVVVPALESPSNDGPGSFSSAEEHTPMLQPPPFDGARATSPQPGSMLNMPRPLSQPPSYEEVLREDGKLPLKPS